MAKENIKDKKGFTIIEVVLVLAIAGLIFLMVFIALPALQRSQRDTQRRHNYANLSAAIISAATNNNGKMIATGTPNATTYLGTSMNQDPSGTPYGKLKVVDLNASGAAVTNPSAETDNFMHVYTKAYCNNSGKPTKDGNAKHFAIYGYLESGGFYCYSGSI